MEEKSEMDIIYEEYLLRDDLIVDIDDRKYYRIIHKDKLSINGGLVLIMIPWKVFGHEGTNCKFVDENDTIFELGVPVHYSFRRPIPRWYLDVVTIDVKNVKEIDEIGDYLAIL